MECVLRDSRFAASTELVNELANDRLHEHPRPFETALCASSG